MAARGGVASAGEGLRYAEYSPPSTRRPDADIDQGLARSLIAVGLGVAALAFAGRYAFQIWKPLEQVITDAAKKISAPSLSSYYKGGFEQKMSRREASLILGVSPSAGKAKIRTAHRRIMILNHPDKGRLALSKHLLPILLFLLRETGPDLTFVLILLYFICGMFATAWLDKRCKAPHPGSELANPGPLKQDVQT
ncbi:dnaJ homolog subfamily C member 15 isoform X1 [Equus asinus]|uniref:dnaJ homolog subfamily C member 15 isoform X1 n=1 Tax=Equus asinus TaxID=9793 RepID=UPI0038F60B90